MTEGADRWSNNRKKRRQGHRRPAMRLNRLSHTNKQQLRRPHGSLHYHTRALD
ncbi:hypothetical protein YC2023_036725 [Brassica napus]